MSHRFKHNVLVRPMLTTLEARETPAALAMGGLSATYYDNDNFTGATVSRTDATINFDWKNQSPVAGIEGNTYAVRWTGVLVPKFSETYTLSAFSDDGVRVWVNGKLVVNNWVDHSPTTNTGTVALAAGVPVSIRVDYKQSYGGAVMQLSWASRSQAKQIIPAGSLGTTTDALTTTQPPVTTAPPPANTPPTTPAAPSGLKATAAGTSVMLAWTDNSADEIGFQVERSFDGWNWAAVATAAAGKTAFTDTGLPANTVVAYRVRAVNAAGAGEASNRADATTTSATPAPTPATAPTPTPTPARTPTPTPTPTPAPTSTVTVGTLDEFRAAVRAAVPGTTILVKAGVYGGDSWFANVQGTADKHIVIAAADASNPPIFRGGSDGMHFVDAAYLELRNLVFEGQGDNGLNIDDNGSYDTPCHDLTLSGLVVRNVGPNGNRDGIKLSGVDRFTIESCTVTAWGSGGSAIDMVGCHDGTITGCTFANGGLDGGDGVQAKGGSARIAVRGCRFENAGDRAIQLGGYTEAAYYRFLAGAGGYEIADATVEGNVIIGSESAVAFVNVDGATVRNNTIHNPSKYVFRILQEVSAAGFVPCRNGVITDNIITFNAGTLQTAVNVGTGTAADTFSFARNWWYAGDTPSASQVTLPVKEENGTAGIDPLFVNLSILDLHLAAGSLAANVGAYSKIL